jgi:hypothetical protein
VAFCTLLEFEDLDLDRYAEMAARGSHDGLPDEFEMPAPTRVAAVRDHDLRESRELAQSMRVTTDRGFGFARISPSG